MMKIAEEWMDTLRIKATKYKNKKENDRKLKEDFISGKNDKVMTVK